MTHAFYSYPKNSTNQFFKLLEALPLIVYSVEPEPPFLPLYCSPGIEVLGYPRSEWLQVPDRWFKSLHPDDRDVVLAATDRALQQRQELDIEYRMLARDGSVRWMHDRGHFAYDGEGTAFEFRGFLLDVTERKSAQVALVQARNELRQAQIQLDRAQQPAPQGTRAENIVRELNDILQTIALNAALTTDRPGDRAAVLEEMSEIQRATVRAAQLARTLLDLAR